MENAILDPVSTAHRPTREEATNPVIRRRATRYRWLARHLQPLPDRRVRQECGCRHPFSEPDGRTAEVRLDVRDLPIDGQIGRTLEALETLPSGGRLRHVNTVVPWPLFAMLETRGYRYRLVRAEGADVEVLIWRLTAPDTAGKTS